jgi:PAS domain S-box-containing protein
LPSLATSRLTTYALRQEVLATLGKRALAGDGLTELLEDTVRLVAEALEVPYAGIFEFLADSGAFLLRAGSGWKDGLVGRLTMAAEPDSQAGYAFSRLQPVSVEDGPNDSGLRSIPLFDSHDVVASLMVVIQGRERPFGVLGAHGRNRRRFSPDEVQFLHSVALLLAQAIERDRVEREFREQPAYSRAILERIPDLVSVIDPGGIVFYQNQALRRVAGFKPSQLIGKNAFEFIHPDDLPAVMQTIRGSFDEPEAVQTARFRIAHRSGAWVSLEGRGRWVTDEAGQPRLVVIARESVNRN